MKRNKNILIISTCIGLLVVVMLVFIGVFIKGKESAYLATGDKQLFKIDIETQKISVRNKSSQLFFPSAIDIHSNRLYVANNSKTNPIVVFDTKTLSFFKEIKLPEKYPVETIKLSPDGKFLYIAQINPNRPIETLIVDPNKATILKRIEFPLLIGYNSFSRKKDKLYGYFKRTFFVNELADNISREISTLPQSYSSPLNIATTNVEGELIGTSVFREKDEEIPHLIKINLITGDVTQLINNIYGKVVYNPAKNLIYLLEVRREQVKIGKYTETLLVNTNILKVIDGKTYKIVKSIKLPQNIGYPSGSIFLNSTGKYLLIPYGISYRQAGYIVFVDTNLNKIINTIEVGGGPTNIVFDYTRSTYALLIITISGAILIIALAIFFFIRTRGKTKAATV